MRTARDRVRHAILFEVIGLALITPLSAVLFQHPIGAMGVIAVASATIAMLWNYAYNYVFDHAMHRLTGGTRKTVPARVLHAILFEVGLVALLMPMIAWYLGIGLWEALTMDIAIAGFYVVYAFAFNWAYDRAFPLPVGARNRRCSPGSKSKGRGPDRTAPLWRFQEGVEPVTAQNTSGSRRRSSL